CKPLCARSVHIFHRWLARGRTKKLRQEEPGPGKRARSRKSSRRNSVPRGIQSPARISIAGADSQRREIARARVAGVELAAEKVQLGRVQPPSIREPGSERRASRLAPARK